IVKNSARDRARSFFSITHCGITHWEHLGVKPISSGEWVRVAEDSHEKSLYHARLFSLACRAWVRARRWHHSHAPLSFLAGASLRLRSCLRHALAATSPQAAFSRCPACPVLQFGRLLNGDVCWLGGGCAQNHVGR